MNSPFHMREKMVFDAMIILFLISIFPGLVCYSADSRVTYQVGPGRVYETLQDVAGLLNPGDIVEVDGECTYPGNVVFDRAGTESQKIYIKGIRINGSRPVISGGTNAVAFTTPWPYNTAGGGHHYIFEGFEITGASSRGIFHQARDLIIRDCYVHHCPNGVLGADQGSGNLLMEYTEIAFCGEGSSKHQVYMATDEVNNPGSVFRMQHCYIHDGAGGNNVKSRAERNEIYYNWVEGAYYHELELIGADYNACDGDPFLAREDSDVAGNVLVKKQTSAGNNPNFFVTRVGGDGTGESHGRYRFLNNTIICGTSAVFRIFDSLESIEIQNNVFYNPDGNVLFKRTVEADWVSGYEVISGKNNWVKTGTQEIPAGISGTVTGDDPLFMDISGGDLYPGDGSQLIDAGSLPTESLPGFEFPDPLPEPLYMPPEASAELPGTARERNLSGTIDIGAFERQAIQADSAVISLQNSSLKGIWLWSYDETRSSCIDSRGSAWEKILAGISASKISCGDITGNSILEIVALFPGHGLWYYRFSDNQWIQILSDTAGCIDFTLAKTASGQPVQVAASLAGQGLLKWEFGGIWTAIHSWSPVLLESGNINRDALEIDELIIVFDNYPGLFLYDFQSSAFTNVVNSSPSMIRAGDVTGDGFKEIVCVFAQGGTYICRYVPAEGMDMKSAGEMNPGFDIFEDIPSGHEWVSKGKDMRGFQFNRITYGTPDSGHDIALGDIAGNDAREIIFTYYGRTYSYLHDMKGWTCLVMAPFKKITAGKFTGGEKDDIIGCETSSGSIYLRRTETASWEILAAFADAECMAVLKQP